MKPVLHKLFFTPVWEFVYPDFKNDEEHLVRYLAQDKHYLSQHEKNGLQITHANLHKDEKLKKLKDFILESARSVMNDMGYQPDCGLTSLWATRQRMGGNHHHHIHKNTFIGFSMHVFSSGQAPGMVFVNSDAGKYQIDPPHDPTKEIMLKQFEFTPFQPGHIFFFPAWATHFTEPNTCDFRMIVAGNIMPIGMSNGDHFDRYNYADPEKMVLKEYGK